MGWWLVAGGVRRCVACGVRCGCGVWRLVVRLWCVRDVGRGPGGRGHGAWLGVGCEWDVSGRVWCGEWHAGVRRGLSLAACGMRHPPLVGGMWHGGSGMGGVGRDVARAYHGTTARVAVVIRITSASSLSHCARRNAWAGGGACGPSGGARGRAAERVSEARALFQWHFVRTAWNQATVRLEVIASRPPSHTRAERVSARHAAARMRG